MSIPASCNSPFREIEWDGNSLMRPFPPEKTCISPWSVRVKLEMLKRGMLHLPVVE